MLAPFFLLLLSACIYAFAFLSSTYFWWLIFFFPIPLFYCALHKKLTFRDGYFWGLISFGLHLSGPLYGIFYMTHTYPIYTIILVLLFILYESLYAGLWFWLTVTIINWYACTKTMQLMIWILTTLGYFYWINHYCLFIFGRCEGYFFMHPLLPLAVYPPLLFLLPIVGKTVLLLFLLMVPGAITIWIQKKTTIRFLIIIITLSPWIIGVLKTDQKKSVPHWLSHVTPAPLTFAPSADINHTAYIVCKELKQLINRHKKTSLIIFPESAFYETDFSHITQLASCLDKKNLGKSVDIILGAFLKKNGNCYNTLYLIKNGKIQHYFNKRHTVILTQRLPFWLNFPIIHRMFFDEMPPISACNNPREKLIVFDNVELVPYICSDLFFNEYPDDNYPHIPILAITNDRWTYKSYIAQLMRLSAAFKAIEWQRDILYISYLYATFFDKYGNYFVLD